MKIGEIMPLDREIVINEGKKTQTLLVANIGDRPVQVGSHFQPGEEKEVSLTEIGGSRRIFGLNDLTCAQATEVTKKAAVEKAKQRGFIR